LEPGLSSGSAEQTSLIKLSALQTALETRLNAEADRALNVGRAAALKTPPELETARKHLKDAAQKYHFLENPGKTREAQQQLKVVLETLEKQDSFYDVKSRHATFLAKNLTGGRKKKEPSTPESQPKGEPETKKQELK